MSFYQGVFKEGVTRGAGSAFRSIYRMYRVAERVTVVRRLSKFSLLGNSNRGRQYRIKASPETMSHGRTGPNYKGSMRFAMCVYRRLIKLL